MIIALVRHGQTDWNAEDRMQGSSDIPLNEVGRAQAVTAAEVLSDAAAYGASAWSTIISSPLQRAHETASIIASRLDVPLGEDMPELVERHYGEAEGMTIREIDAKWARRTMIPGVEPVDSVVTRGVAALDRIAERHDGSDVVVVCHGTLIRLTLGELAGHPVGRVHNGVLSTVEYRDGEWVVLSVNGLPLGDPRVPAHIESF
ncbi:histidine phosphatase family protein [Ruicaihuangia caeni]|uniref:histidine phosphatase family protein n=1 Tax=Ruicaihuangia caeni TaxID=3042517 RepID=UPI00338E0BC6